MIDHTAPRPRPSPHARCALCHDGADDATTCPGCETLTHPSCRDEARGVCPTLGCAHSVARVVGGAERIAGKPGRWDAFVHHPVTQTVLAVCLLFAPFLALACLAGGLLGGLH